MASDFLVRLGVDYQQFVSEMAAVSDTVKKAADDVAGQFSGFDRIGQTLTGVGTAMTAGITLPLAGIGFAAATAAGDFEGAMNRVKANIDGVTDEGLGKLDALAKKLGADTKFSALEAAQGMAEFAAAGYSVDQVAAVIGPSLNLAAAAQTNVGEASKITKDILGQFGLSAESAGGAVDLLAKAGTLGSGTLMEVANSLSYVGPNARAAGMDLAQTSSALLVLDEAGIRGEKSGTALRAMLASLAEPSTKASKVMAELGIATTDAAGNFLPFPQIMENFKNGLQNAGGSADRLGALTTVFGREALAAATVLTNQGAPALIEFEKQLRNSGGAADTIAKTMNSGMNGALEQLKGSLESAAIAAGQVLIPVIVDIAGKIQWLVDNALVPAINWFKELPTPVQNVALGMVALAAAVGPVVLIAGQLLGSISSINAGLAALGPIIGVQGLAITTLGAHFTTLATGGLTAAQGALASFGTAITGLPASITALGQSVITGVGSAIGSIPGLFVAAKTAVVTEVGAIGTAITSGFSAVPGLISSMGTAISGALSGALTSVTSMASALIAPGGLAAAWAAVQSAGAAFVAWLCAAAAPFAVGVAAIAAIGLAAYTVYKNWDEIVNVLKGIWLDIANAASKVFDAVKGYVESALGPGVMRWLGGVWDSVGGVLKKAWAFILDIVDNGLKYIVNGAQSLASAIGATNTAAALKDWSDKLSGLKKSADDVTKSSTDLKTAANGAAGAINTAGSSAATAHGSFKTLGDTKKAAADAAKALKEEAANLERSLRTLGVENASVEGKVASLNTAMATARTAYFNGQIDLAAYNLAQQNHKKAVDELLNPLGTLNGELQKLITNTSTAKTNIEGMNIAAMSTPSLLSAMNTEIINQGLAVSASNAQIATMTQRLTTDVPTANATAAGSWGTHATAAGTAMTGINTSMGTLVNTVGAQGAALAADLTAKLFEGEGSWRGIGVKALGLFTGDWKNFADNAAGLVGGFAKSAIDKLFGGGDSLKTAHGTSTAAMPGDWKKYADTSLTNVGGFISGAIGKLFGGGGDSLKTQHATGLGQIAGDYDSKLKVPALQHVGSLVSGAIGALVSGEGSFGDRVKSMLTSLVGSFASMAASWISEATGLKDSLNSIFGQIKVPSIPGLGGSTPSTPSTGVPGGGANTGGSAGSFFDVAGVVSQISSAITGIIGVFQAARQENSLNAIEENTRDTESEVRNLRSDAWLRETHLMTKLDELLQFTWIKLDEIINGVGGGGSAAAPVDLGLLTQAAQAVEAHTNTLVADIGGFRTEVSTGFGNSMAKADDLWGTLRNIETNTKPTATAVDPVPGLLGSLADGLRNINLTGQGVIGAIQALGTKLNPEPGHKSMDRAANFTSAIHDFVRDDVVPTLDEIHGKLFPQYAFYDRIEKSLAAAKSGGGTSVTVTFGDISVGAGATRDSARELVDAIEPELLSRLRLAGAI